LEKFELISNKIVNVLARPASGGARYSSTAPPPAALPKKSARTGQKSEMIFVFKKNAKILKNFLQT